MFDQDKAIDLIKKVNAIFDFLRAGDKPACITAEDIEELADIGTMLSLELEKNIS